MMNMLDMVEELLIVSQKAANLARAIRSEQALFSLLVEEKTGDSKNKRFIEDFKTLADVLVQEVIIHDLGKKFPRLVPNIQGEESNTFTNTLGESVTIRVKDTVEETTALLAKVLDDNQTAASLLANLSHSNVGLEPLPSLAPLADVELQQEAIGIWIDPIDSTAQYIHGYGRELAECGVCEQGLQCVVVLIGVFDMQTGLPVAGVVNQPFYHQDPQSLKWQGRYCIGFRNQSHSVTHFSITPEPSPEGYLKNIVLSSSEKPKILGALSDEFKLVNAAGAGYKILCVIDDLVGSYVLSKSSTFKWDTCSPHAILLSMGGGIIDLSKAVHEVQSSTSQLSTDDKWTGLLEKCQLHYHTPDSNQLSRGEIWSNTGGILAYHSTAHAIQVILKLAQCV